MQRPCRDRKLLAAGGSPYRTWCKKEDRLILRFTGTCANEHDPKYLQQLCKPFAHKTEVTFDPEHGKVAQCSDAATLQADAAGQSVTVNAADSESLPGA